MSKLRPAESWVECPDPVHKKRCGWFEEAGGIRSESGYRVVFSEETSGDRLESSEIAQRARPWTLVLAPTGNDDLAGLEQVLQQARRCSCDRVLCKSPQVEYGYRYRLLCLIRSLCDEASLGFAVLERPETPAGEKLNRFLAHPRACCRAFPW